VRDETRKPVSPCDDRARQAQVGGDLADGATLILELDQAGEGGGGQGHLEVRSASAFARASALALATFASIAALVAVLAAC